MKEERTQSTYELIIKDIQTFTTVSYLMMIGIGMIYKNALFSEFGINIFQYADVFDFLITPFQDIKIIIVSLIAMIIPFLIFQIDIWMKKRFPKTYSRFSFGLDKKPWYNKLMILSIAIIFLSIIFEAASGYANHFKHSIDDQGDISIEYQDNEIVKGKMIGKTKETLFLWKDESVKVIPITSLVKSIEIEPR